jgi:hypothetical protein
MATLEKAQIERLQAALKPFAAEAARHDCLDPPLQDDFPIGTFITVGHCRRAREALEQITVPPEDE